MIYHILTEPHWAEAQAKGTYEPASLSSEGFIHLSKREQVLMSAQNYFQGVDGLLLLFVEEERLQADLVWENTTGGDLLFPHLYGALNLDAVIHVGPLLRDQSGRFIFPEGP